MAILIAYYSRAGENYFGGSYRKIETGNTARCARKLAALTGGSLLEIRQEKPYSENLDGYDEIYLGYPNFCGTMPMAVFTFLEHYDFTGKTIHPFCTHEGSGLSHSEADLRTAAPGAALTPGLAIHGSHVDEAADTLSSWVQSIEAAK